MSLLTTLTFTLVAASRWFARRDAGILIAILLSGALLQHRVYAQDLQDERGCDELSTVAQVADRVAASVVRINTNVKQGSGVIVDVNGHVVTIATNRHVLSSERFTVR